ncbi:MAG: class I SAM-dependent methyltransferase [Verrucomicrobiota bacterium]
MTHPTKTELLERLRRAAADGTLVKLNLGVPVGRDTSVRNIFIRPVRIRGVRQLAFTYRHARRDVVKNLEDDEAIRLLEELVGGGFLNAFLSTTAYTAHWFFRKGRPPRLVLGRPEVTEAPDLAHDRPKQRQVVPDAIWLRQLQVTTPEGKVRAGMEAKYRQIHRFVELLDPLLADARLPDDRPWRMADMGCGKGYLTFAAYEHLLQRSGRDPEVLGVEERADLVEGAAEVARACGFTGLQFLAGRIQDAPLSEVDILVALHACDTATDDALARGIGAGARLLVVSPCCHREVRPQLEPGPGLEPVLRHGILRERQAELATDALRAALLEAAGYEARVCEFVSPEHTGKNLMIAAVRRARFTGDDRARCLAAVGELARLFGIRQQALAGRLGLPLGSS